MLMDASILGYALAFAGGMLSFLSPCVLPLVPGYLAYVAGANLQEAAAQRWRTLALGGCFVLGFSLVFVGLGLAAGAFGFLLRRWSLEAAVAGGTLVIALGLVQMGVLRLPFVLMRDWRPRAPDLRGLQPVAAVLVGMAFGFGWTPCIGPVLGAVLAVTAATPNAHGTALLAAYAAGLGVPFLLAAFYLPFLLARLRQFSRAGRAIQLGAGGVMVAMGVALMTGNLTVVAGWIMQALPGLVQLG